jgi:hypothetical protein
MKTKLIALITLTLSFAIANTVSANFFQGFETNNLGWNLDATAQRDATRVASGTHGIPSKTGNYHAEAAGSFPLEVGGSTYTRWGGYSFSFPTGGYITDVSVYLDTGAVTVNDTRFDWSSAINQFDCAHRRDFVFNAGFYNDSDGTGTGPRFVISAGNNAGRANSFPKNPGHDPFTITNTGWYTLEHQFNNVSGVLVVTMRLLDSNGVLLHTWTLSDPSDVIGTTVGGNRYGWFASQEFPFLAFDDSELNGIQNFCGAGQVGTVGYWQNHPEAWCAQMQTFLLGCETTTEAEAIDIMQRSTSKDMTYALAAQVIAAELNTTCLSSNQACVSAAITAADQWLCDNPLGTGVKANSPAWRTIRSTYNTLVNYNEGQLCAPHRQ